MGRYARLKYVQSEIPGGATKMKSEMSVMEMVWDGKEVFLESPEYPDALIRPVLKKDIICAFVKFKGQTEYQVEINQPIAFDAMMQRDMVTKETYDLH